VKKQNKIELDFEVDELTNSIRNVISGDNFQTDITRITKLDLKSITKKSGWLFDWKLELKYPERDVYKLTIVNNQSIIQGLISLEVKSAFISKTQLIDHYIESLGATHFGGRLMIIDNNAALKLMNRYFSNLTL